MKIQVKLVILVLIIIVIFTAGMFSLRYSEEQRSKTIFAERYKEKVAHFDKIVELKGLVIKSFVYDNSYWDDLVKFINKPDPEWAYNNLESTLINLSLNVCWVYDKDFNLVYNVSNVKAQESLKALPFSKSDFKELFKYSSFKHFYLNTSEGLIEIRTAPIQSSSDFERTSEPKGYLIAGKILSSDYLNEISALSGDAVSIVDLDRSTPLMSKKEIKNGKIVFEKKLYNAKNYPIVRLRSESISPVIAMVHTTGSRAFYLLTVFSLLSMSLVIFIMLKWVNTPLSLISKSLNENNPEPIKGLLKSSTEFGNIAQLITNFFYQKKELLKEIEIRKQREKEILEAKEMAIAAMNSKSQFLSTMSHEIRTPMNGVLGMADLLTYTQLTQEQKGYLEIIQMSGKSLLTIINDILDFSKIESGKIAFENKPINFKKFIRKTIELSQVIDFEKNLKISHDIDDEIPEYILSDSTRLQQILLNLVNNAIKFTPEGEINIKVELLSQINDDLELKFAVKDTGIGIPANKLNRLFKSFSQVDSSHSRKYGGTGLGLVISAKLLELMNGQIWVESKVNVGTTFFFTIKTQAQKFHINDNASREKLERKIAFNGQTDRANSAAGRKVSIMVAEDNPVNLKLFVFILTKLGYNTDIAENGEDVLKLLSLKKYDIIFMDVQMPIMDGIETTEKIIELYGDNVRPIIIALTANAMVEDREKCMKAGMDDYISKPIKIDDIETALNKWTVNEPPSVDLQESQS